MPSQQHPTYTGVIPMTTHREPLFCTAPHESTHHLNSIIHPCSPAQTQTSSSCTQTVINSCSAPPGVTAHAGRRRAAQTQLADSRLLGHRWRRYLRRRRWQHAVGRGRWRRRHHDRRGWHLQSRGHVQGVGTGSGGAGILQRVQAPGRHGSGHTNQLEHRCWCCCMGLFSKGKPSACT